MPRTMINSSGRRNGPYLLRCSTMRAARAGPMPGSVSSSCSVAVFMSMRGAFVSSNVVGAVELNSADSTAPPSSRPVDGRHSCCDAGCETSAGTFCEPPVCASSGTTCGEAMHAESANVTAPRRTMGKRRIIRFGSPPNRVKPLTSKEMTVLPCWCAKC